MSSRRPSTSAPQRGGTPKLGVGTNTPRTASATATNGTSAVTTRPGSTVPTTIMRAGTPMNIDQRGKKREREDGNVTGVNGVAPNTGVLPTGLAAPPPQALMTNGYGNGIGPPKLVVNARAGTAGIRPRPTKKQKMVCSLFFFFLSSRYHYLWLIS